MSISNSTIHFYGFCVGYDDLEKYCRKQKKFIEFLDSEESPETVEFDSEDMSEWFRREYGVQLHLCGNYWSGDLFFAFSVGEVNTVGDCSWCSFDIVKVDSQQRRKIQRLAKKLETEAGFCLASTTS
jgi:hypothetical protein